MIQMMPVLRNYLTPESALAILDYSPLPAKLVGQLRQMSQQPPSEDQQQQKQLAIANAVSNIKKTNAQADQAEATAERDASDSHHRSRQRLQHGGEKHARRRCAKRNDPRAVEDAADPW